MSNYIYNHYNKNGEYTGSTVKCPGWLSPNFIKAIGNPILISILFPLTPVITAWIIIGSLVYYYKRRKLGVRFMDKKDLKKFTFIPWTIFMNFLWVVWLFLYFIL